MNTSKEYIVKTLKSWEKKFPGIHLKYAFEKDTCFHVIEVEPEDIHEGSDEYAKEETELWETFFDMFPDEEILITSPSPCNDMRNVIYETGVMTDAYNGYVFIPKETRNDSFALSAFKEWKSYFSQIETKRASKGYNYSYKHARSDSWGSDKEYLLAA